VLSKSKGEGFAARSCLENDGDAATQEIAFERDGFMGQKGQLEVDLSGLSLLQLTGRGAEDRLTDACATADLVVLAAWRENPLPKGCTVLDRKSLAKTGAVAVRIDLDGWSIEPSRRADTTRLWTR
jgi:competence protein ComEC